MLELFPYVPGFQPKRIADRHEGEEPARVIAEKPILSLPRALDEPLIRLKLFMKADKSIFEYSVHQCPLRAHGSEFDPRVEKLFRKHAAAGGPLISAGPAGDQPLASVSGRCAGLQRYCSYNVVVELQILAPLTQSVERIYGKEKSGGLFSSSGDQQEQPLVQVNVYRSIWI